MSSKRRSVRLVSCMLVTAVAAAACTHGHHDKAVATGPAQEATASPVPSSASPTPDAHAPSVRKAPKINSDGITPLTSATAVTSNAVYPIPGGIKAGETLAIAINCQGPGRLTVRVEPTGISFPLLCEKGKVLPTMNEIHMSKNHARSALRFISQPNVTWSFSVGWDPHPPKQL